MPRLDPSIVGTKVLHFPRPGAASPSQSPPVGQDRDDGAPLALRQGLRGRGLKLFKGDGQDYLDAVSGTFNLPLGYDHPQVVRAVTDQLGRLAHVSSHFSAEISQGLKRKLLAFAPSGISAVWLRDITGSTAVEGAIKIAQKATGKRDVISLFHSHHGQTLYATALSGNAFRRESQPDAVSAHTLSVPNANCHRCFYDARYPECGLRCATRIQDFIDYASSGSVAALIVEPVQGNGGNVVPPPGYFATLRELCTRNGMLLIADEVQTGIGRTGHMYACETFGIEPDIMVLAKGLGGIGIPVGAILMKPEFDVLDSHEHSFTSGANLLALAAAETTLDVIGAPGFLSEVRRKSTLLRRCLEGIAQDCPAIVSEVRGVGFMWGLDLIDAAGRPSAEVAARAADLALAKHRLILRTSRYGRGNVIKVRPALIANEDEIIDIACRLKATLTEVADSFR